MNAASDDHQQIVEVMGDAARELTQRVKLLTFRQLPLDLLQFQLRLAALGQITRNFGKAEQLACFVVDRVDNNARPEEGAVLADAPAILFVAAVLDRKPERTRRPASWSAPE
jgi:hypothetical protein